MANHNNQSLEKFREIELSKLRDIVYSLGYSLDEEQPHISGERYLMQAVTTMSGQKFILLAKNIATGERVVIKASNDCAGKEELTHERLCRNILKKIGFAYHVFKTPEEILFSTQDEYLISIQKYIEQSSPFLERPIEEQFTFALEAFKAQEGVHATTYGHAKVIQKTFGSFSSHDYLSSFNSFRECVLKRPENTSLSMSLDEAHRFLSENQNTIEQYSGFLTHTDFVPHNFRIADNAIYLLDHSSLRFGNKYEGWARFLNFMTLYNPALEEAFLFYIRENRTSEETLSLRLMRVYRLGEILCYYTRTLPQSSGDLYLLNEARIAFWGKVLKATLKNEVIAQTTVEEYQALRDSLRSDEEKKRQRGLH